jgi:hypothetical protein
MKFVGMGSYEIVSRGAVAWRIGFSFLRESFFFPWRFGRTLCQLLTLARKKLLGIFLFQDFSGTAHSFS